VHDGAGAGVAGGGQHQVVQTLVLRREQRFISGPRRPSHGVHFLPPPDGSLYPEDQPDRVARWNTLLRQAAARHPGTAILDLNTKLGPNNTYTATVAGITVRSDGVHLTPTGVTWLSRWLIAALHADKP